MKPELLRLLAELSVVYPEMRLGQLVEMLASFADVDSGDASEDQLLQAGESHLLRRLTQLGMSREELAENKLPAARADLLAALGAKGPALTSILSEWGRQRGERLYDAEDEALLAVAQPRAPVKLGDWFTRVVSVAASTS